MIFNNDETVGKADFCSRLVSMPYKPCLGPPYDVIDPPSETEVEYFYDFLTTQDSISQIELKNKLSLMFKENHGISWTQFKVLSESA